MASYNSHELDFDTMPIPFRCVATDLTTLKTITFSRGPLPVAVRASISIPGIFPPVKNPEGHFLVDGGVLNNLPTDVVRRDLKSDIVIAVYLKSDVLRPRDTGSLIGVLERAFVAGTEQNVALAMPLANLVISVPLDEYTATDYAKSEQIMKAGYDAAEQNRAALLKYALNRTRLGRLRCCTHCQNPSKARHAAQDSCQWRLGRRHADSCCQSQAAHGQAHYSGRHRRGAQADPVEWRIFGNLRNVHA